MDSVRRDISYNIPYCVLRIAYCVLRIAYCVMIKPVGDDAQRPSHPLNDIYMALYVTAISQSRLYPHGPLLYPHGPLCNRDFPIALVPPWRLYCHGAL